MTDPANGYDRIADRYITARGTDDAIVGAREVRAWVDTLPSDCTVLDLGCGSGYPVTRAVLDSGRHAFAIDASPNMVAQFSRRFPDVPVACELAEQSRFFDRQFDAIIAWGLISLLAADAQGLLISGVAKALLPGGRLLFTAPSQVHAWKDVMTGEQSVSLGRVRYCRLMTEAGLTLTDEFEDAGENHYYATLKRTTLPERPPI